MNITKGCKIWLWILIIGSGITALGGIWGLSYSVSAGVFSIVMGILQFSGTFLLLFKQRKEGFYLLCIMAIINFVYNIAVLKINIVFAICSLIAMPAITYFFINKGKKEGVSTILSDTNTTHLPNSKNMNHIVNECSVEDSSESYSGYADSSNNEYSGQNNNDAARQSDQDFGKKSKESEKREQNAKRTNNSFEGKMPVWGSGKNIEVNVDLYKELDIDRSWDEKTIRNHLKDIQKTWIQRQGATNDKEQLLLIDNILENVGNAMRYLTKKIKRQQYDQSLELAYKAGKIRDVAEEKLHTILEQARAYYRKGNIKLATKFAEEAVQGEVNDVSAYDLLARCYFDANTYDKALGVIDQGLSIFKTNINLQWLGARIATIGTKNFNDAQQRVNRLIEMAPGNSIGYSEQVYLHLRSGEEQLAFQEIDSYIAEHPEDNTFKRGVAYDLDAYSNTCYYYDAAQNASFIADKSSYERCLTLRTKAAEIFEDEHTKNQLESAKYYGKKEWNDWNLPSIKSLAIYGTVFTALGFASDAFFPIGIALYIIMGVLIYFSFRPYWQINKTYVTGQMGTVEKIVSLTGDKAARMAEVLLQVLIQIMSFIFKFIAALLSGRWF
mgnify:CR=1 FL=1